MSIWKRFHWPILAGACAAGCVLLWVLKQYNLYLHIRFLDTHRAASALVLLFFLCLFLWLDKALLKRIRTLWGKIAYFILILAQQCVFLFVLFLGLWFDGDSCYCTLRSPSGEQTVVVDEECLLLDFAANFYEPVFPGLMKKLPPSPLIPGRIFSQSSYELSWEPDQLIIYYESRSYGKEILVPLSHD